MDSLPDFHLDQVGDRDDLGLALNRARQRAGLSYAGVATAAARLPRRSGRAPHLPRSTISDICTGRVIPTNETLLTFLSACGVHDTRPWIELCDRLRSGDKPRTGDRRVRDATARDLGVHAAIRLPGTMDDLPGYIERDGDHDLRNLLRSFARGDGGFVLIVGTSSTGKTRSAYEAVQAELAGHRLVHPHSAEELRRFSVDPPPGTVVWLDELQKHLAGGLAADTVRALRASGRGIVLVGTLWPDRYHTYKQKGLLNDAHAREREVLELAEVIILPDRLSTAERERATTLAARDMRVAYALSSDVGVTQALAAAPELMQRWRAAPDPYCAAVIAVAADARRMGAEKPLTDSFLAAALPGYLTANQRARAPSSWLADALRYALEELHGSASALTPHSARIGTVDGYTIADYLLQHAEDTRRDVVPPASLWNACATHLDDGVDLGRLGLAAKSRGLRAVAARLWQKAVAAGDVDATFWYANLLDDWGRLDEAELLYRRVMTSPAGSFASREAALRNLALALQDADRMTEAEALIREGVEWDSETFGYLLTLLLIRLERYDEAEELTRAFDLSVRGSRRIRAELLYLLGRVDEAKRIHLEAAAEDSFDLFHLAVLLRQDEPRESERLYRQLISAGSAGVRGWLALLLSGQGEHTEAEALCREAVALGDRNGPTMLAHVLEAADRVDEAEAVLRDAVAGGDLNAFGWLVKLLTDHDRAEEAAALRADGISPPPYAPF